jgi:hypothetical protein
VAGSSDSRYGIRGPTFRLIANRGLRSGAATAARAYTTSSSPRSGQVMASSRTASAMTRRRPSGGSVAQTATTSTSLCPSATPPSAPDPTR